MNEAETRAELIDPALKAAGWGEVEGSRVLGREVITLGRLQGAGKRASQDIADYVLFYRGQKLAVIEAKRRDLPDTEGVAQAKKYATTLQTRFTYSTNGAGIYQIDMKTGAEGYVERYPTPEERERLDRNTFVPPVELSSNEDGDPMVTTSQPDSNESTDHFSRLELTPTSTGANTAIAVNTESVVGVGSKVTIEKMASGGGKLMFTIVENANDPENGLIGNHTPLGQALLVSGRKLVE